MGLLSFIRQRTAPQFFPLFSAPQGFFAGLFSQIPAAAREQANESGIILSPEHALTLSPFYAGVQLYINSLLLLPLITYRRKEFGRERARQHPAYKLLSERLNPAHSRADWVAFAVKDYFLYGNSFQEISWRGNNNVAAIYPVPAQSIVRIDLDKEWRKTYTIKTADGERIVHHEDMIHVMGPFSRDGVIGISFWQFAAESLGLHRQVLTSASSFFRNAARPSVYVTFPGALNPAAMENNKKSFKEKYAGPHNAGEVAVFTNGGKLESFPHGTAEDAQIIEALNASVADIARWFGLAPSMLGDQSQSKYASAGADQLAFWQRSLAPIATKFELEINDKLFGSDGEFYCEFLTQKMLETDPEKQADIYAKGIQAGYYLRSEVRTWLNLDYVEGLDQPLYPLNMGPELATNTDNGGIDGGTVGTTDPSADEQPIS